LRLTTLGRAGYALVSYFTNMIGTIRKHSKWLWAIIIVATIASFVIFFSPTQRMGSGNSGGAINYGSIDGEQITQDAYRDARNEFYLFHLLNTGEWPDKDTSLTPDDVQRQIYVRLLLIHKAKELGIYVGDDSVATEASRLLHSPELVRALHANGSVPMDDFVQQVLQPEGLTANDFENFVRHDLAIQQLVETLGLAGELVTPQEAAAVYTRDHQELSVQAVFFSATNYLSQVHVTPEDVAQFYTNYLAEYRLPDRVSVSYVEFNLTNYLAESKAEWAKTNLNEQVDDLYTQYGANAFPDAKTPEAAKAQIREALIRRRALADAHVAANAFASIVFNMDPVKSSNLATVAKQKGYTVHITAPFSDEYGPSEFEAPGDFTKAAFDLTTNEPLAGPVIGPTGIYIIALNEKLPSEIPSLESIHARVVRDCEFQEATEIAQRVGTNFVNTLTNSLAAGKSFATTCVAAGLAPQVLPPFSLTTRDLPELGDRIQLNQLKQVAFTTPIGHASDFNDTGDGGFILYVQSQLPMDKTEMETNLPAFTAALRRSRQNEAFNSWLMQAANQSLKDTPLFQQQNANGGSDAN
jgi:parvulin-like peptidyl-prolyl isomerase